MIMIHTTQVHKRQISLISPIFHGNELFKQWIYGKDIDNRIANQADESKNSSPDPHSASEDLCWK